MFEHRPGNPWKTLDAVKNVIGHYERDFNIHKTIFLGVYYRKANDKLVGIAEIFEFDDKVSMVEIGYTLNENYWGKGIATNAVSIARHIEYGEVRAMICDSCGFRNSSNAPKCINCGAELKSRISSEEISRMIDRLSDRSDALTASEFERILKWILFSLAAAELLLCLIFSGQPTAGVLAALSALMAGICAGYPNAIWKLNKLRISMYADADDLTPNDFWSYGRKLSYWILCFISVVLLIVSLSL